MTDKIFSKYYNRDLSWLLFNRRVIKQSHNSSVPLLERLKFLAIASNNLDEFYSVRVPGIQEVLAIDPQARDKKTGLLQRDVRKKICERNRKNIKLQYGNYDYLTKKAQRKGIFSLESYDSLEAREKEQLDEYFKSNVFPCLTTIQFDHYHARSHYVDGELNIFVKSIYEGSQFITIIPLSDKLDRLIPLSTRDRYIFLEDLLVNNLSKILINHEILSKFVFRVTRDKDIEIDSEIDASIFESVEKYLEEREKGRPSRIEYTGSSVNKHSADTDLLSDSLNLDKKSSYHIPGPLDLTFLFGLVKRYASSHKDLVYKKFSPIEPLKDEDIFQKIDQKSLLLEHPFESFDYVVKLLHQAANDKNTLAIKQTIYRVAENSKIIEGLIEAAKNGIQVTVVIELKARFNEEMNLALVDRLLEAGCYVSFGKEGYKTHGKLLLIVKREKNTTKSYVHIASGNYNEDTSKAYIDLSLLTSDTRYVNDVEKFFNYIVNDIERPEYDLLSTSPNLLKNNLIEKIKAMKLHYLKTGQGKIFFKSNALTDREIIDALYSAAKTGLPIRMVVRGANCMKLGLCGPKENVVISSIVGRFLEHSRIYAFYWREDSDINQADMWISSADLMTRNMDDRIEVAAPLIDLRLKEKLAKIIRIYENDFKDASYLDRKGSYNKLSLPGGASAQETFMQLAEEGKKLESVNIKKIKGPKSSEKAKGRETLTRDYDKNFRFHRFYNVVMILLVMVILFLVVSWFVNL
ncbi:polyphosphate kinase 1 [Streptococcaceae bacterium ESL0729]|nr:polyphosphate kinase 1 [Streptococcaceae bacterium ESL0729]